MPFRKEIRLLVEWLALRAYLCVAAPCLLLALVLAILDRVAAATLVTGIFVVLVLFHYLPQMESFKAYGVEAKWRARLSEADEILRKLKQSAAASARLTYHILGWGSRIGGAEQRQKQELADQVDAVLLDLETSPDELAALKRDYLRFAALDLYWRFEPIVERNAYANYRRAQMRLDKLQSDDSDPEAPKLRKELAAFNEAMKRKDAFLELEHTDFRAYCHARIPRNVFPANDERILREFADRVSALAERCMKEGRVNDEAAHLIDAHSNEDRRALYRELFGEDWPD